MDFSFFRKDKNKPEPAKKSGKAAAIEAINQAPLTEEQFDSAPAHGGIDVVETGAKLAPGIEEAAMLYASDRANEAIALLKTHLAGADPADAQWRMLFDLYRVTQQRDAFEQLALDFAVQCETSPPVWVDADAVKQPGKNTVADAMKSSGQLFSLKGSLDETSADRIALLQSAAAQGAIQLDLSGINAINASGSQLLKDALSHLQKKRAQLQIASGALISLLQHNIEDAGQHEPAHWLLLLQLYQLQGKQAEFEDLAVDYAVRFEVSPPSWETPGTVAQSIARVTPAEAAEYVGANGFSMHGVINGGSIAVFDEFRTFAATRSEVELDLADVQRVEFASVNLFMDALMSLLQAGKHVRIVGGNEMVNVVLIVMGVDQMAEVVRRRAN
ncbi:MAG TPA: STAS domain-containing protein [Sulfuriferula sp.]|nr:STAS domain-containing protein [Sulfuriferula sp.]